MFLVDGFFIFLEGILYQRGTKAFWSSKKSIIRDNRLRLMIGITPLSAAQMQSHILEGTERSFERRHSLFG